jgi:hypothetical protein
VSAVRQVAIAAVADAMDNAPEYVWRQYCRIYSEAFCTPLHVVLSGEIEVQEVVRAVTEHIFDSFGEDDEKKARYANGLLGVDGDEEKLIQEQIAMFEEQEAKRQERLAARKARGPGFKAKKSKIVKEQLPEIKKTFEDTGDPDKE